MAYTARTIRLVFFSGTGGTQMAAAHLASALRRRGVTVFEHELHVRQPFDDEQADLLVLMYPVYAGSAPAPVYAYLKSRAELNAPAAAVICGTGGGDAAVNRASRQRAIRLLEDRDCRVVYEGMLVMPSNAITPTPYNIALRLIKILPEKIEIMAGELVSGVTRRIKPGIPAGAVSAFGEIEKRGAVLFGKKMEVDERCIACAVCADACPTGNITMENGKPCFSNKCATCMRCVYSCPENALSPRFMKWLVLKEGFNLKGLEKGLAGLEETEDPSFKGVWRALKPYFQVPAADNKAIR